MKRQAPPSLRRHAAGSLRGSDPIAVFAAAELIDADLIKTAEPIMSRALTGNIGAAREVRGVLWPRACDEVADYLDATEAVLAPGCAAALKSHLTLLPLLSGAVESPGSALMRWAVVGVRQYALHDPLAYEIDPEFDPLRAVAFERALLEVSRSEVDPISWAITVLGVTRRDIGRWVRTSGTAVTNWSTGLNTPRPATAERLAAIGDLASLADEHIKAERIPAWFAERRIPALDDKSVKQVLDEGWDPLVVSDFIRFGFGHEPVTAQVRAFAMRAGEDVPLSDLVPVMAGPFEESDAEELSAHQFFGELRSR